MTAESFISLMERLDGSVVALTIMSSLVVSVVWSWHSKKEFDFHLQQVLVDNVSGKISIEKVGYMTALAIATWGFVALILRNQMTEWFFTAYISVFVLGRSVSSGLSVWKEKGEAPK